MACPADYIGCMKNGDVYSDSKYRWYERQWPLLGKTYFTHAWGTLYVVSGRAASSLAGLPSGALRFFTNEGVSPACCRPAFSARHQVLDLTGCRAAAWLLQMSR